MNSGVTSRTETINYRYLGVSFEVCVCWAKNQQYEIQHIGIDGQPVQPPQRSYASKVEAFNDGVGIALKIIRARQIG